MECLYLLLKSWHLCFCGVHLFQPFHMKLRLHSISSSSSFSHTCLLALCLTQSSQVRSGYRVVNSALFECEEQVSISLPLCSPESPSSSVSASFSYCSVVFYSTVCLFCKRLHLLVLLLQVILRSRLDQSMEESLELKVDSYCTLNVAVI